VSFCDTWLRQMFPQEEIRDMLQIRPQAICIPASENLLYSRGLTLMISVQASGSVHPGIRALQSGPLCSACKAHQNSCRQCNCSLQGHSTSRPCKIGACLRGHKECLTTPDAGKLQLCIQSDISLLAAPTLALEFQQWCGRTMRYTLLHLPNQRWVICLFKDISSWCHSLLALKPSSE